MVWPRRPPTGNPRRFSAKHQILFAVVVYGGLAAAVVLGISAHSFLLAVFVLIGVVGAVLLVGSVAMMVRLGRRRP
jgi:hypothetical protein